METLPAQVPAAVDTRAAASGHDRRRVDRLVIFYVLFAVGWISLGSFMADAIVASTGLDRLTVDIGRGVLFAVVTGLLLRVGLLRHAAQLAAATDVERQAAFRLREIARVRASFLRGISHELRTPLTNIVGYGLTLRDHLDRLEPTTAQRLTGRLVANATRLERLVLDLLDVDAGSSSIDSKQREHLRVDLLVADVVAQLRVSETAAAHRFVMTLRPAVGFVDRASLERVVAELLGNALRHTPAGTTIRVRVARRRNQVRLVVADDGPGIDPELAEAVFEPFTQGAHTDRFASPGLGIGLAIVQRLVGAQQGHIRTRSRPGAGARFEITLPAAST